MKKHLSKIFFCCLALLQCANQSHAKPADYFISENLVTFSPSILEGNNHHPCQGVRISSKRILTSEECVRLISEQIGSGNFVEVLSKKRSSFGKARLLSNAESKQGLLGLDAQKVFTKPEKSYPSIQHNVLAHLKPAQAFYRPLYRDKIRVISLVLIYHRSDTHHHYIINASEPLPAGTPVVHDGKVVCSVGTNQTCKVPVMDKKTVQAVEDCKSLLPDFYYYSGCVNRTITTCSHNLWETKGAGTCTNAMSQENCSFWTDIQHAEGATIYAESVKCPSCSADFSSPTNICRPALCLKGCDENHASNGSPAPVNATRPYKNPQESCDQCLAQEQQMFNNCQQICQAGFSYQACKSCSEAVDREEAYCKSICDPGDFAGRF